MSRNDKIKYSVVAILVLSVITYSVLRDNYREKKLKNVKNNFATFDRYTNKTAKGDEYGYFHFTVFGKTYTFREAGNYSYLRKGDLVEIEYSIADPSIARVK